MLKMKAQNLHVSIGDRILFDIADLRLHEGERIGLVGKNGQGKSMLLKTLIQDSKHVVWYDSVASFEQLNELTTNYLSGGEKTLKKLKKVMESEAGILLLDEPTNNLDLQRIEQLEKDLLSSGKTIIVVSHDRVLLDRICTQIWELDAGDLTVYSGNYSFYQERKKLQLDQQYQAHEKYLKEKKRLEEAMKSKHDQAKGMRKPPKRMSNSEWQLHKNKAAGKQKKVERVSKTIEKRLDQLEKVDKPFEWDKVKMDYQLRHVVHRKNILVAKDLENVIKGRLLYQVSTLKLKTGSKTAIIGANGTGKTAVINQLIKNSEQVDFAQHTRIGYLEQALESLPGDKTIYQFVSKDSSLPQYVVRIILGRLLLSGESVNKSLGLLSGGERVKVAIARLLVGNYNVLVLDEPTNHIDLEARRALAGLIKDYPGTILYVSHDRRFVEETATDLWILNNNTIEMFAGSWKMYEEFLEKKNNAREDRSQEEEVLKLETKLSELISRLSIASKGDDKAALEKAYHQTLELLQKLKNQG